MSKLHPARTTPFRELLDALNAARQARLVTEQSSADGLRVYCYTPSCVYGAQWNDATLVARGLVLDIKNETVVATPFPKFFNASERGDTIPDLPFETFEKVDGSLIIIFWHAGEWKTATKGTFISTQARWAAERLKRADLSVLERGTTYLAEAIYAENRIVVRYAEDELVLLSAYNESGAEISYDALREIAERLGWRTAKRHRYDSISQLVLAAEGLPANDEGFVVRFSDGTRLKIKGAEYRRIHALISRITPLAMWERMYAGEDLLDVRKDIPEEFWQDFDAICDLLSRQRDSIIARVKQHADSVAHLSDKEVGLQLNQFPAGVRALIFPYRNYGGDLFSGRSRQIVFHLFRPTANDLPGYASSYAIKRILEESA